MHRHSKLGSAFDADERDLKMTQVLDDERVAIGEALAWLDRVATTAPTVRAALERQI